MSFSIEEQIEFTGGWVTLSIDVDGRVVQYNVKTKEVRKLDEWVEIGRVPVESTSSTS